jgi:transposase, IS5 family
MRFVGLALEDWVPEAQDHLVVPRAADPDRRHRAPVRQVRCRAAQRRYLARIGQIVDATVVETRRPRLTKDEKARIKGGGVRDAWSSQAKRAQMDTDGR